MASKLSFWQGFGDSKLNPVVRQQDTRPVVDSDTKGYNERSIDEIKLSFVPCVNPYTVYLTDNVDIMYDNAVCLDKDYNQYLLFNEFHPYYRDKMKTDLGTNMLHEIVENIFDSNTLLLKNKEEVDVVHFETAANAGITGDTNLDLELMENMVSNIAIYGKCGVGIRFKDGDMIVDVVEPWRYVYTNKGRTSVRIARTINGNVCIEERLPNVTNISTYNAQAVDIEKLDTKSIKHNQNSTLFFELEGEQLFTEGIMHALLLYADVLTSIVQENDVTRSHLFIDKGYLKQGWLSKGRRFFTKLDTPQTGDLGTATKALFEVYNPEIRSAAYENMLGILETRIAKSLRLYNIIESTSNATAGILVDARDAKRYNKLKSKYEISINMFLNAYIGNGYELSLTPYTLENKESQIKNAVLMNSNGLGHQKPVIELLYPDWTEEERDIYYLTTEIKNGRKLTLPEEERAVELKLMDEPIDPMEQQLDENGQPIETDTGASPPANQSGNEPVGEKQMENADKVNVQGVDTPI